MARGVESTNLFVYEDLALKLPKAVRNCVLDEKFRGF